MHRALFALRHDAARQLNDRSEIAKELADEGVPADAILEERPNSPCLLAVVV